jgi:membrane protease YdiL (CAAX protease family)
MKSGKLTKYFKEDYFFIAVASIKLNTQSALLKFFKSASVFIAISIAFLYFQYQLPLVYTYYFGHAFHLKQGFTFVFFIGYVLLCLFVLPAATAAFIYKEKLRDIGLRFPENKKMTVFLILLALLLLMPEMIYFSKQKQFQVYYSYGDMHLFKFILIQLILIPVYYFAEEFFFRGFLFVTLWRKVKWHSFWITEVLFTLAHLGKPSLEVLLSIPVSIILNTLVLNSRSIYPAMLVHYSMGTLLNVLVNYNLFR